MAIELCSEKSSIGNNPITTTPRLSFSYDFLQSDIVPIEQQPLRSNSNSQNSSIDFDFCVRQISLYDQEEHTSADELFSDGKILPTELKKKTSVATSDKPLLKPDRTERESPAKLSHGAQEESRSISNDNISSGKPKPSSSSFWSFKRSSSCGSGMYGRTLCPIPLLSRSNSTGSADETKPINIKRTPLTKEKDNSKKAYSSLKPPLKKSLGAYGNGVSINPVLNVSPANILAVGSIFSSGKSKNKKK